MKLEDSESKLILQYAKDNGYVGFHAGKFHINGARVSNTKVLSELGFPAALKMDGLYRVFTEYKDLKQEILNTLRQVKTGLGMAEFGSFSEELAGSGIEQEKSIRENILIFKTIRRNSELDPHAGRYGGMTLIAFNPETRAILSGKDISIDALLTVLGTDREEILLNPDVVHVWPVFNPYVPDIHFEMSDDKLWSNKIQALNTAIPPRWMTHADSVEPKLGGFIGKLILHLFPDPEDRERVLDWCHYAIFKRNGTVLCLAGDRGTGKSTFVEILSELVGSQYSAVVGDAILQEKFNSAFKDKRLIIFEEVALEDQTAINKVKAWCNNKISVEEKGVDQFTADNFTSMVFLLNNLADLKVLPQERRFSIPVVATESLLGVLSEKEIDAFKTGLQERRQDILNQLAEFGYYLKNRKPKYSEHIPIKGANFFRVSDLALTEWQAYLREFLQNRGEIGKVIPITVIFPIKSSSDKDSMKFPTKKPVIDNFLRDYRFQGKYKMGDLVDIPESEIQGIEKSWGVAPQRQSGSRTRRLYGIMPRESFLREFGMKYKNSEDLL